MSEIGFSFCLTQRMKLALDSVLAWKLIALSSFVRETFVHIWPVGPGYVALASCIALHHIYQEDILE